MLDRLTIAAALTICLTMPARSQEPARAGDGQAVVMVSLDGFRADYLDRYDAPNLRAIAAAGVRAEWMTPVFPSLTFPNHYSIVTGLYPAHHGIVNNNMLDPVDGARFRFSDSAAVGNSRWWLGEPLWITAERQGVRAGVFFWVGSEAAVGGRRPTFWKKFDDRFPEAARVDSVLGWLTRPDSLRVRLANMYLSTVDHFGHTRGPDAPETRAAVLHVDSLIGLLRAGIARAGIQDRVNVIVVSDHGMAPISMDHMVPIEDYLDASAVVVVSFGELIGINTRDGNRARVVQALRHVPHLGVWDRDSLPARWHYSGSPRIPEVVGVTDVGWELVPRSVIVVRRAQGTMFGGHGNDDQEPLMRALFVAAGPSFRQGVRVPPFRNIHVYDLVCRILGIVPAPNDGSPDSTRALLR